AHPGVRVRRGGLFDGNRWRASGKRREREGEQDDGEQFFHAISPVKLKAQTSRRRNPGPGRSRHTPRRERASAEAFLREIPDADDREERQQGRNQVPHYAPSAAVQLCCADATALAQRSDLLGKTVPDQGTVGCETAT